MRLATKFLLFNILVKGSLLLLFLMLAPGMLSYFALKNTDEQLRQKKAQVLSLIETEGIENFISEDDPESGFGSYNILKEEYVLLELLYQPLTEDTLFVEDRILDNESVNYRVLSHTFEIDGENYLLEIGRSIQTITSIKSIVFRILLVTLAIYLFSSFILDTFFTQRILEPFHKIFYSKISQIKAPQQFPYQPIKTSTEEFRLLDEAISSMMKRIQKVFIQEREFISFASHELKTPISALQGKVEALFSDEKLDSLQVEKLLDMQNTIQNMKQTVNALLLISKVNNAQFVKTDVVDIEAILHQLHEDWSIFAADKGVDFSLDLIDPFVLNQTNHSLFHMMLQNALVNAIKYTPEGGRITISAFSSGDFFKLIIKDTGEGIPPDMLKQVEEGQVFLKNVSKDSSGFGMQIMFKIALYLNIKIEITTVSPGTQITFHLPEFQT
jgi:signal transduction histidine kinase